MSYWHHEIIFHDKDAKPWYGLHEVHFEKDGEIVAYTQDALYFAVDEDEGPEELIRSVELALQDIKKHPIRKDSEIMFGKWNAIEEIDNDDTKLPDNPT